MIPSWIKTPEFDRSNYVKTRDFLINNSLHTVCQEANCPNRYECFANKTATFLILGDVCTRNCKYCNISSGVPKGLGIDSNDIIKTINTLGLKYVVITSVTRDDLDDGGVSQYVKIIKDIRALNKGIKIELLIPDYNQEQLVELVKSKPDVINHNIEVVKDLFYELRPQGNYQKSLEVLNYVSKNTDIPAKSGLMVGFGETISQITSTLEELKAAGVSILTIGQYLQPSPKHAEVQKYYKEEEFQEIKDIAKKLGFKTIQSGSLVRSSYHANKAFTNN